jgi:hypothetical protein
MSTGEAVKNKDLQEVYFRFLNLFRAVEAMPGFPVLDNVEKELLDELSISWKAGQHMLVSDAIALAQIGSPATLHARLKNLRREGMIEYMTDDDARKKYIQPTDKALKYFSQISDCMRQASQA